MNDLLTRGADGLVRRGFSLDEIERMLAIGILDPDEKFELIDGEIVPMRPRNMPHVCWRAKITKWFVQNVTSDLEVAPEATLTLSRRPARTFEADILLFRPVPGMTQISPADVLLAIEIADTTRDKDMKVKAPRYGDFGVAELWVVDLNAKATFVHRQPRKDGYDAIVEVPFNTPLTALFDPALALTLQDIAP
jgi:Uma2 family endonuclease